MKFAILALCLALAGCSHPDYHANIQKIIAAKVAEKEFLTDTVPMARVHFPTTRYADWIASVNLDGCPDDFKAAWLAYASAWSELETNGPDPVLLGQAVLKASHDNLVGAFSDLKAARPHPDPTAPAWHAVREVATKYGVLTD